MQKIIFPLFFVTFFIATIGLIASGFSNRQNDLTPAVPTIAELNVASGNVTLGMTPATISMTPNTETTITLTADTTTADITGASIELSYNPTELLLTNLTPSGTLLPTTVSGATINNGVATIVLGVSQSTGAKTGSGTIATVKVKPLKSGTFTLSYGTNSFATGSTMGNKLKSISGTTIVARGLGDVNGDGTVNILDFNPIATNYGQTGAPGFIPADFYGINGIADGKVDLHDYSSFVLNFGKTY